MGSLGFTFEELINIWQTNLCYDLVQNSKQLDDEIWDLEEPELNKVYKGTVVKIVDFGAFVNILPGKDGLLHISEISAERTEDVNAVLSEGQEIDVKLIGFDRGKMKLSVKALAKAEESEAKAEETEEAPQEDQEEK